jgi:hypothetical protein
MNLSVTWAHIAPGLWQLSCWTEDMPMPIGYIQFIIGGKAPQSGKVIAEVFHGEVLEPFRRQGVRTFLQEKLIQHWNPDVIMTQAGTEDGAAWMKARGYKVCENTGMWFVTREAFQASAYTIREDFQP